jgi:hypothetical protein
MLEEVFVEDGMVKEEIKVREYGWWTSRKPLAIASNGAEGVQVERTWRNLCNVKCNHIWNCHDESPTYNKYILILKSRQTAI